MPHLHSMYDMPHLIVSISGHGFGHVAQTAPVLNALHQRVPDLRITLRSTVPTAHLRSRIHVPFEHLGSKGDIGMMMSSAVDVLPAESRAAYRAFHSEWDSRIADEAGLLHELGADMVLSNVGYLPLAGAQRAGIPNAALCSLNWFEIYRHYCGAPATASGRTDDEMIAAQIRDCYANADAFLRITPGLAMDYLPNLVEIAPIAAIGNNRREELDAYLRLSKDEKLALVSLGGIESRLPMESWPRISAVRWLVQKHWQAEHPDAVVIESLPMSFSDLLASSDVLICKPGYGSFVEAACSGVPVLYTSRDDWPETSALAGWLRQHAVCREVSRATLERGDIKTALDEIWKTPRQQAAVPQGAAQAADWLMRKLNG